MTTFIALYHRCMQCMHFRSYYGSGQEMYTIPKAMSVLLIFIDCATDVIPVQQVKLSS